ncbi:MAG: hypothetical protein IJ086_15345 [Clostridium sp.]|nr:hypothetical protein [Clostridium sp.]MBQ9000051.1 hypothetical protein [Clostridium sp.]
MVKRNKKVTKIIGLSLIPMFMVGCNSNGVSNNSIDFNYTSSDLNIKKVSDLNIDEYNLTGFHYISTDNNDTVKKYDKLDVMSYNLKEFNSKTKEYIIDILIKNNSNETVDNIIGSLGVFHENGAGFENQNINLKSIAPGEIKANEIRLSQEDLYTLILNNSDNYDEISNLSNEEIIQFAIDNKLLSGEFHYTYDNDYDKHLKVSEYLSFDGNVTYTYINTEKTLSKKEFDKSKSYHVENGSYLNIVNNEKIANFDNILLENIEVKIDENFDIQLIVKFKNDSDEKIENFSFDPYLNMLGYSFLILDDYEVEEINTYKDDVIEPGDEFEIAATLYTSNIDLDIDFVDMLRQIKDFDMNSNVPTIAQLIENRLFNIGISYSYDVNNFSKSIDINYAGNGKINDLNCYERDTTNDSKYEDEYNYSESDNLSLDEDDYYLTIY